MVVASLSLLGISVGLGIWMAFSGAPYHTGLLTLHKLISLGFAVLGIMYYIRQIRGTAFPVSDLIIVVIFIVALIALLATGGFMSAKQESDIMLRWIHILASIAIAGVSCWKLISHLVG